MMLKKLILSSLFFSSAVSANTLTVTMQEATVSGTGKDLGTILITEKPSGLLFEPHLKGLALGEHGFHIHENPSCSSGTKGTENVPALSAGGHFDREKTGVHCGPHGEGHIGDLPKLTVSADDVIHSVLAPRIKSLSEIKDRSLIIHLYGDNYSDTPEKLGGGAARIACGIIGSL